MLILVGSCAPGRVYAGRLVLTSGVWEQRGEVAKVQRKAGAGGSGLPGRWIGIGAEVTSRLGGGQAGNQRNFGFSLDARHAGQLFFSRRFQELPSADGSCRPDLRKEVTIVVAIEDQ